jgi:hypothetical protein
LSVARAADKNQPITERKMNKFKMPNISNLTLHTKNHIFKWREHEIDLVMTYEYDSENGWCNYIELYIDDQFFSPFDFLTDHDKDIFFFEMIQRSDPSEPNEEPFSEEFSEIIERALVAFLNVRTQLAH